MTERQNWIQNKFNFFKTHIRRKGLKSPAQGASASAASAHDISRVSTNMDSVEISKQPDTTIQPSVTSPSFNCVFFQCVLWSTSRSWISLHRWKSCCHNGLRPKQETTRTAFYKYLAPEVEALEDTDFQTFRNKAGKLLSSIQSKAEDRSSQPQPQQQIHDTGTCKLQHLCHRHFNSHSNQHQL